VECQTAHLALSIFSESEQKLPPSLLILRLILLHYP
jgi:hypothetical protein